MNTRDDDYYKCNRHCKCPECLTDSDIDLEEHEEKKRAKHAREQEW